MRNRRRNRSANTARAWSRHQGDGLDECRKVGELTLAKGVRVPYFIIMDRETFDLQVQAVEATKQAAQARTPQLIPQISPITDSTGNPLDSTHSGTPDGSLMAVAGIGKAGRKFLQSVNQAAASI